MCHKILMETLVFDTKSFINYNVIKCITMHQYNTFKLFLYYKKLFNNISREFTFHIVLSDELLNVILLMKIRGKTFQNFSYQFV